jgi:hypothetical protein
MRRWLIIVLWCVAQLAAGAGAVGDEVVLSTGERLRGTVVRQDEAAVVLNHPILGRLELKRAQVKQVLAEEHRATATAPADATTATVPVEVVATAPAVDVEAATAWPATQPSAQTGADKGLAGFAKDITWWRGWKSRLEAGLTGEAGEEEELVTRAALVTQRKTEETKTKGEALYYLSQERGNKTKNEFTAAVGNDWLLPSSPWLYFGESRYEYDEFADWNQRIAGDGGVGSAWWDTPKLHFDTRVGAGASKEFGGEGDEVKPEGLLGADLARKLADGRQEIAATTRAFPDLAELGEWRTRSSAEWRIKLSQVDGMSLKLGLEHEYETESGDQKQYDLKYFAALVCEF